jgi:ubiquinone/menaquinone biosynthesis C-methylase UbiE
VAFEELKQRQSFVWGNGEFERISATAADIYDAVVGALAPVPNERWLDLACGTGPVAERATAGGAQVVGIDLAPVLIETAKRKADEKGLDIDYRVGDCENLAGIEDGSFDVVSSTFGVMFAPDQAAAAGELARVVRPGGRLGLATWTPEGGIGAMLEMTAQFQPPPPEGAGMPLDWGRSEHVEALLGGAFDLNFEKRTSTLSIGSGEEYWQLFVANFGPVKTLAESMDDERREEFHRAWVGFFETNYRANGSIEHPREYLLILGTRRA